LEEDKPKLGEIEMPFKEDLNEFKKRMGCGWIYTESDGYLFANGGRASWDGEYHMDPPEDEKDLITLKRAYVEHKLKEETKNFNNYKQAVSGAKYPPAEAPDELRKGKRRIEKYRQQLADLQAQFDKLPEERARREHEREMADLDHQSHQRRDALRKEIDAIEI